MDLKKIYNKYSSIIGPILFLKNRIFNLKIKSKKGNRISGIEKIRCHNSKILITGTNNTINFGEMSTFNNVNIYISGSNNKINIGDLNYLDKCEFIIEDDNNSIKTGEHVYINGGTQLSAIEGTKIVFGDDCLLSSDIFIRTGDSHSIIDLNTNSRCNKSIDVIIGNHVWIGNNVKILKGTTIGDSNIIGTGAILTSSTPMEQNVALAGSPARIIKKNVTWEHKRI